MNLWSTVLGLFRASWVMSNFVVELLACWQGWFSPPQNGHLWIVVPHGLLGCLWREEIVGALKIM